MHPYLKASLELELAVGHGEHFQTALARISRPFGFTKGERELITSAYMERKAKGKTVRVVEPQVRMPRPR